ncbi:MAG TPA: nitrous oxide reductase accessory protein NosL [Pyrinomonadaceae bacterium]
MLIQNKEVFAKRAVSDLAQQTSNRRVWLWAWCLIIGVTVLANCQKQAVAPVALAPEDTCSYCKMAISEKQYAAELIDSEGQTFKFDDIGCMANFIKSKKNAAKTIASFVMDFNERQWIKAEDAHYVRSSELSTPMNGGLIAFKTEAKAQEAGGKFHGKLLRFKDIFNP